MKKIITLLLCAAFFTTAFAQTSAEESRRIILGKQSKSETDETEAKDVILGRKNKRISDDDRNYPNTRTYPSGNREQRVEQVNREYDAKVQSIRNNRYLSSAEKQRAIRDLNNDRARKIRAINEKYGNNQRDRRYDRDDNDDDRKKKNKKYKKNNGNHYGWQKGKGNPHRDRDDD